MFAWRHGVFAPGARRNRRASVTTVEIEKLGSGVDGGERAGRHERSERYRLLARPQLECDQGRAHHCAEEEPQEEAEEHVAPREPPQGTTEDEAQPDVAESHPTR